MKPPSIRRASAADLDALTRMNAEVQALHFANRPDQFKPVAEPEIRAWLAALLENPSAKIWVAELDGTVGGYAVIRVRERSEDAFCRALKWWDIDQVGVRSSLRRSGVGRALLEAIHAAAREAGISKLELMTWAFNTNARAAFAALGFEPKVVRFELAVDDEGSR